MIGWRSFWMCSVLILSLLASACGGGSTAPDPGPGDNLVPTGQWTGTAANSAAVGLTIDGVPEIPSDSVVHSPSSEETILELLGSEYLQKYHAEVAGTSLVLNSPAEPPEGEYPISYGLYKFAGLNDVEPQWLNIECLPQVLGDEYYVALADYTERDWRWFGPVGFPEFQLDLRDLRHRVVSELGNMYFIVVTRHGNVATLSKSSLTVVAGGEDPGRLPGAPNHLAATDGVYDAKIVIEWAPGIGADSYELWRRAGEDGEWDDLAILEGTRYEDTAVEPGLLYWYKAFSVNEFGRSSHSNIDEGYAGELGGGGGELPAPHEIWASDGAHPDHVVVEWGYTGDYTHFELWRRLYDGGEFEYLASIDGEHFRYEDYEVTPGTVYKYKVRAMLGEHEGPFSEYDTGYAGEQGGGELPAPFELVATDGVYGEKVVLEWGYEGDYHHFNIWRRVAEGGEWVNYANHDGAYFRFEDLDVEPGVIYEYKVRAIFEEREGPWSNHDFGHAGGESPAPHAPFDLVASKGLYLDKIRVEWNHEGAKDFFELWRKQDGEGFEWHKIADVEGNEYNDTELPGDFTFIYKARASLDGHFSEWSNTDHGYLKDNPGELPAPHEIWASDGAHPDHVVVEWGYQGDYTYFELWRRPVDGGEFAYLASIDGEHFRYEDYEVTPGTVYKYQVRAILGEREGPFSEYDTGYAAGGGGELSTPFELTASKGEFAEKIQVSWGYEGDYGYFEVWRKQDGEGHEWAIIGQTEATHYADVELPGDFVFLYKVRARLEELASNFSNIDHGYLADPVEYCTLEAILHNAEMEPVPGFAVLYGLEEPVVHEANEHGVVLFGELPRGLYLVVPVHREIAFYPIWRLVDFREGTTSREVGFLGSVDEGQIHRLRGAVYKFNGELGLNRFHPIPGVVIDIAKVGSEETWRTETDEAGYWTMPDLPVGTYIVTPVKEGFEFTPEVHDPVINGENLTERCDFRGYPIG